MTRCSFQGSYWAVSSIVMPSVILRSRVNTDHIALAGSPLPFSISHHLLITNQVLCMEALNWTLSGDVERRGEKDGQTFHHLGLDSCCSFLPTVGSFINLHLTFSLNYLKLARLNYFHQTFFLKENKKVTYFLYI